MRRLLAVFVGLIAAVATAYAAEPEFSAQVAPIFKKYCVGCHNPTDHEGKLSLETFAQLQQGGENGAVVVASKSGESLLIQVLTGKSEPKMPPEDEAQPSAEEIAVLASWIDAGAKAPTSPEVSATTLTVPKIEPRGPVVDPLSAIACSPDGAILAEARYGAVELRRRTDRSLQSKLEGHRGRVTFVSFSPDGTKLLAAAGEPGLFGEVRLWNVADGQLIRTFTGHRDNLYAAVLTPDGTVLATASYDQQVKLWNVATGAEQATLSGHNDAVYDLAFRPDGRVLASVSGDRTVKLWDVAGGKRLDTLSQSLKELYAVAFRPDGKQLVAGGVDGRIRIWNISADAKENTNPLVLNAAAHEGPIVRLIYSRDGSTLISSSEDRTVKIWDASSMSPRGTLEKQPDWPAALAIAADQQSLFVGRLDGSQAEYPLGGIAGALAEAKPLPEFAPVAWYGDQPSVDQLPKAAETEPNDAPPQATTIATPSVATGVIKPTNGQPVDADFYRFDAKAGDQWVLEVNAARSGSKLDSRIEVLHADGRPVEQLLLRAVRDSELEFRSKDSSERGMRLGNWEELELNRLVYLEGEVIKHFQQRQGPDNDGQFYPDDGSRFTYFGTSPRTHALGVKCYFVEPYAVGTQLPYNGLPVFPIKYENDDDGERKLGTDSIIQFTAPSDGTYLVRVTDVRGFSGDTFTYQLIVRRPHPNFSVRASDENPTVRAGSGKLIKVLADRTDGFTGPIEVNVSGLPAGFYATSPIVIQPGHRVAYGVVFAHPAATAPSDADAATTKITATATRSGQPVTNDVNSLGKIQLGPKPKILVKLALVSEPPRQPTGESPGSLEFPAPAELTIAPGGSVSFRLMAERNGFDGIISFDARNLPHGVIVDNIGLNGIQLLPGETERALTLSAEQWMPDQDRLFYLASKEISKEESIQVSLPLMLKVRRSDRVAANGK